MVALAPAPERQSGAKDLGAERRGPFRPDRLAPTRERMSGAMLARLFRGLDVVTVALLALVFAIISAPAGLLNQSFGMILPLMVGPVLTLWALSLIHAYDLSQSERLPRHISRIVAAWIIGAVGACLTATAFHGALGDTLAWAGYTAAALAMVHTWAWLSVRRWRKLGRLTPNVVVVGATDNAAKLIESALASREVNVLGIFDDRSDRIPEELRGVPVLGSTNDLLEHKILPFVDRVVITVTPSAQSRVRSLIERLRVLPNAVTLFVDVEGQDTRAATLSRMADAPLAQVSGVQDDERRAFWKRVQDIVIGTLCLIAASPIMLIIAIAIRLDSPGPVIFRQRRHGFNNEAITVFKFRSMRADATDHTAKRQVEKNDDRVTKIGRFIRRTSLDELPQFLNVIQGHMSLVGPRPHPIGMMTAGEESQRLVAEYAWRHRMKPGITGWAQINGSRGPVHSAEEVRTRVVLDVEYIERQSFLFDLYIILMTVPCLLGDSEAIR